MRSTTSWRLVISLTSPDERLPNSPRQRIPPDTASGTTADKVSDGIVLHEDLTRHDGCLLLLTPYPYSPSLPFPPFPLLPPFSSFSLSLFFLLSSFSFSSLSSSSLETLPLFFLLAPLLPPHPSSSSSPLFFLLALFLPPYPSSSSLPLTPFPSSHFLQSLPVLPPPSPVISS